ncbi:MAG: hypothetical protein KDI63_09100 [Gammaproteobacteria bacterium]|nr:hypothetical protein [Gammaproteobacteria bacterium]
MNTEQFYLVLSGNILDGYKSSEVVPALGRLLRMPDDRVRDMLQGRPSRIRKALEKDKALRMMAKILACGAGCDFELVEAGTSGGQPMGEMAGNTSQEPRSGLVNDNRLAQEAQNGSGLASIPLPETPECLGQSDESLQEEPLTLDIQEADPPESSDVRLSLEPIVEPPHVDEADADEASEGSGLESLVLKAIPERYPLTGRESAESADRNPTVTADSGSGDAVRMEPPSPGVRVGDSRWARLRGVWSGKRPVMTLGAVFLAVAVVAGGAQILSTSSTASRQPEADAPVVAGSPVDPKRMTTQTVLEELARSVRIWMIQYGSGFDPSQVTMARIRQDLQIAEMGMLDGWGNPIHYRVDGERFVLISAGPDEALDSADDLVLQRAAR